MATATSPYQGNDYNAASSYRPYQLPVNDIFKSLSAQNQFWEQGAARVKNIYDSALGLDLTLDENKTIRDQFIKDAEGKLKKLSSMNLADPSVQREGMDIFKNLFKDTAIMYDDFLTKKQSQVVSEARRYKNDEKTKGEGFHMDNLNYALKQFEGFGNTSSRGDLEKIYQKAKNAEYIPYHDVNKEYLDLASKCKGNSMSHTSVDGLYFHKVSSEGPTESDVNGCLKAGLSDKGWQQLRITGTMRYGNNIQAVAQGYSSIIEGNNQAHSGLILELSAEKKKLRDAGQLSADMEKAYDETIGKYKSEITKNGATLVKIAKGDYSDVEKDYDGIIAQVYASQDIGGFAKAFRSNKTVDEYSANAAGIAQMREAGENARWQRTMIWNQMKFGAEMQMKQNENDIELLKAFMGGGGSGSSGGGLLSMSGGLTYETFSKFVKPITDRLGIDMEGINSFMDDGTVVKGVGETFDGINQKANQFDHERRQTGIAMYNTLKEIVGPEGVEALNKQVMKGGSLNVEALYGVADKYLSDYHKTPTGKGYAGKLDQIEELEELSNKYTTARSNVWTFMKMRDEINKKLDADPQLKKQLAESNQKIDKFFSLGDNSKAIVRFDPYENKAIVILPQDLKAIALGSHNKYKLQNGKIVIKGTSVALGEEDAIPDAQKKAIKADLTKRGIAFAPGYGSVWEDGNWNLFKVSSWTGQSARILTDLSGLVAQRNRDVLPKVSNIMGTVVRNTMVHNVGNVPGLGNSIKQQFTFLQGYNTDEYQFRPGVAYRDGAGNPLTTVKVFKKNKVKEEDGTTESTWSEVSPEDIKEQMAKSNYAIGGSNNISFTEDGQIAVKTPYLPVFQNNYSLSEKVSNEIRGAQTKALGPSQKLSIEVNRVPGSGGFKVGFDVIGAGKSYLGDEQPRTYKIWYMTPTGEKEYIGVPAYTDSEVANQLELLEQKVPQYADAYNKKKK